MIATNFDDLLAGAGTSMAISPSVEDLGGFTTYVPMMLAIRSMRASDMTRVAFVGTPCQIKTLRKMQLLQIVPAHIVRFTIGLFCYENFNFTNEGRKYLEKKIKTPLKNVAKINVKEDFIVKIDDGRSVKIDLDELGPLVRPECIPCTDFSNYTADISVGGLGSPDGYTTTMIRSLQAKSLIEEAIAKGYLKRNDEVDERTMIKKIEDMARRKHDRGMSKLKKLEIDRTN
jgi:coenzyme F420 hydrogenase subunit beta